MEEHRTGCRVFDVPIEEDKKPHIWAALHVLESERGGEGEGEQEDRARMQVATRALMRGSGLTFDRLVKGI
jgi:hypothetical protein